MSTQDATVIATKFCSKCGKTKPVDDFWRWSRSPSGRQNFCKSCCRAQKRLTKYGLTEGHTEELLASQGGLCAICPKPLDDKFHTDHDHSTGAIRALLCASCNKGLGHFDDNPTLLDAAANYLRKASS